MARTNYVPSIFLLSAQLIDTHRYVMDYIFDMKPRLAAQS